MKRNSYIRMLENSEQNEYSLLLNILGERSESSRWDSNKVLIGSALN